MSGASRHEERPDPAPVGVTVSCALLAGICALCIVFTPMGPVSWALAAVAGTAAVAAIVACR